jgi:putative peptidoglycan lipid II flippase
MRAVASAAGVIAVLTLLARVVGFGRWFVFSHAVGATCVGTTYQSVNAVPNVLFEVAAGGVLAAVAVPLVAGALARGQREDADRMASALLTWSLVVLLPLGVVVALAAGPVSAALLSGGQSCEGAGALGADLLRLFAIQVPLYGVGIVLGGVLQAHRRFVGAALAPLLSSLLVIVTYLVYRALVADPAAPIPAIPAGAVLVLGVGTSVGVAALSLPLLVPVHRAGVRLRPTLHFPAGAPARVRQLAVAGLLALSGQQLAMLAVIWLSNERGGPGTLNVYTYVQAVALLPYAVLAVPLATAAFPSLAEEHATAPSSRASTTLGRTWLATVLVGLLSAGLLVAVARPVGSFFTFLDAGRGESAGAAALGAMAPALALSAPGVLALAAIGLLSRALYVRGRARLAGLAVALGWLSTLVLPLVTLGADAGPARTLVAVGAGMSLGLVLGALGLVALASRAWGRPAIALPRRPVLAGALAAAAAGAAGWSLGGVWLPTSLPFATLCVAGAGATGLAVFAVVAALVDPSVPRRLLRRRAPVRSPEVLP